MITCTRTKRTVEEATGGWVVMCVCVGVGVVGRGVRGREREKNTHVL